MGGPRRAWGVGLFALAVAAATIAAASPAGRAGSRDTGTLALRAVLDTSSSHDARCPPSEADPSVECHQHVGTALVSGLGMVTTSYSFRVIPGDPACSGAVRVLGYSVQLVVAGKGTLEINVLAAAGCFDAAGARNADQAFTIVGGSGLYASASGSGTIDRRLNDHPAAVEGTETWSGTLVVPGVEFDVTAPTLAGAKSKTVRVAKKVKTVRVTYKVTATDDHGGTLPVVCQPRSGARFKVGRTAVICSATDNSGNTAKAKFTITVKRRR
jgi:HYR domain